MVVEGIRQELYGDIHVGHFFFVIRPLGAAAAALPGLPEVVSIMDVKVVACCQRIQVVVLALLVGMIVAGHAQPGREVVSGL